MGEHRRKKNPGSDGGGCVRKSALQRQADPAGSRSVRRSESPDGAPSVARERIRTALDRRSLRADLGDARRRNAVASPSWQRALDGFRKQARELNSRILTYNLKSSSPQFHKLPLDVEAEIRALSEG